jgi:hypothetical protein
MILITINSGQGHTCTCASTAQAAGRQVTRHLSPVATCGHARATPPPIEREREPILTSSWRKRSLADTRLATYFIGVILFI